MKNNKNIFKQEHSFKNRKEESSSIISKNIGKYPVIVQKHPYEDSIVEIDRKKYLVPCDMEISNFLNIIRTKLSKLNESKAVFIFTENGNIFNPQTLVSIIYDNYKDDDGFLYLFYKGENTFG